MVLHYLIYSNSIRKFQVIQITFSSKISDQKFSVWNFFVPSASAKTQFWNLEMCSSIVHLGEYGIGWVEKTVCFELLLEIACNWAVYGFKGKSDGKLPIFNWGLSFVSFGCCVDCLFVSYMLKLIKVKIQLTK